MAEQDDDPIGIGGPDEAFPRYRAANALEQSLGRTIGKGRPSGTVEALRLRDRIGPGAPGRRPLPILPLLRSKKEKKPEAEAPAKKTPQDLVSPIIAPVTLTVVVKKFAKNAAGKTEAYTKPKRQKVTLSTNAAFDGKGTFTRSGDAIKFFKSTDKDNEVKFDGKDNVFEGKKLSSGVTLYAEGAKPSAAPEDVKLTLKLSGGSKKIGPDAVNTATSIELTLDICSPQVASGVDPPPLSTDDKIGKGRAVSVQNKDGTHERALLIIRPVKPAGYKGDLVLKATNGRVAAFASGAGPGKVDPFTVPANGLPAIGWKLWAEGVSASLHMRDSGFQLGIKGVEDDADHVLVTVVELKLEICHRREKKGEEPKPLSAADALSKGRYLLLRETGKHHPRALLIVHAVKPAEYDGKVTLEAVGAARTDLFAIETPGGAALANPLEIDCKAKNERHSYWVEGKARSGGARDAGYTLCLKDQPKGTGERVLITVVEVEVEAKVPTTPSVNADKSAPPNTHHVFKSKSGALKFTDNAPTVLVRNSTDVELKVTTKPAGLADFTWWVGDNPSPIKTGPVVTQNLLKRDEAKLALDAEGGYAIHGGVGDASVLWNLVLVDLTIKSSRIRRNGGNFGDQSAPGTLSVSSGQFNVGSPAVCAMYAKAEVVFSAGGDPALDTYLDRVHAGIVNVLQQTTAQVNYAPPGRERERVPTVGGLPNPVRDPATVVVDLAYPILDRGGAAATRATGGNTIYLSSHKATPVSGKKRIVENCDSPAVGFDAVRPEFGVPANKRATSNSGVNQFTVVLVAYSTDANYAYVAFGSAPWTADYSGAVATPAGPNPMPVWARGATCGITGAGTKLTQIKHGQRAEAAGCEVRPPVYLTYILDAR